MKPISRAFAALILVALASVTHAATINLAATIDGEQANAGNGTGSSATGTAFMSFDDQTNTFSFEVEWSGLLENLTVAHFHGPAPRGANAGVEVDLLSNAFDVNIDPDQRGGSSIGSLVLTAEQASDVLAGLWYINIHSVRDPGGEIRGQVEVIPVPAAAWLMLSGLAAVAVRRRRH